jgi:hypothetical protein
MLKLIISINLQGGEKLTEIKTKEISISELRYNIRTGFFSLENLIGIFWFTPRPETFLYRSWSVKRIDPQGLKKSCTENVSREKEKGFCVRGNHNSCDRLM